MNRLLMAVMATAFPLVASAAEHTISSPADIAKLSVRPGDTITLRDGTYKDQPLIIKSSGAAGNPVTVRAKTPGKVIFTGSSTVTLAGDHVVLSGIYLKDVTAEGKDAIGVPGNQCRVTDCAVVGGGTKFFCHLIGYENSVDHCYFAEKTTADPTFQIEVKQDKPTADLVEYNHFGHRSPLGKNGGETMRVGYSGQSQWNSRAQVQHNLFSNCDGEIEIISSKSCENVYRYNTFLDCAGFLTLRHGHRNTVDANFFIAHHTKGSGGVRVINESQTVTNNYIEGVDKGAFWITAGIQDGPLTGYTRSKDCLIAFNTVVDYAGPGIELAAGLGTSNRTLPPENVTFANNLFSPGKAGTLVKEGEGKYVWTGNLAALVPGAKQTSDAPDVDHFARQWVMLMRGTDGLFHPSAAVPAAGAFPQVKTDIDGQPRGDKPVIGCDQPSNAPVTNRPLTPKDVGPSWLDRSGAPPEKN